MTSQAVFAETDVERAAKAWMEAARRRDGRSELVRRPARNLAAGAA